MTHASLTHLAALVEAPLDRLESFGACDAADLTRLATMISNAFENEDSDFTQALWGALRLVPRPLRGTARSLLFPEGRS